MIPRVVIDTNIVIASQKTSNPDSPNQELLDRWHNGEIIWLYSRDTLAEYARKLLETGTESKRITNLLARLVVAGEMVYIAKFHEKHYPEDPDDIAFLLCATNGNSTHLVTYDLHLLALDSYYDFTICKPLEFFAAIG